MMEAERYKELRTNGTKLTEEEWEAGWHYCPDWDGMLIDSNDTEGEGSCCTCTHYPYPKDTE